MDDDLDYKPTAEEVWPPAPTLPPPEPVRPTSFMVIHPVLSRFLISVLAGLLSSAIFVLLNLATHRRYATDWTLSAIPGFVVFAGQLFVQFGIPALARAEVRKKERKAALEAEAAEQDATA